MRRFLAVAGVVAATAVPGVAPAQAAGATLAYSADRTAIVVTLTDATESLRVSSGSSPETGRMTFQLTPGSLATTDSACSAAGPTVHCDTAAVTRVYVHLRGGDDVLTALEDTQGAVRRLIARGGAGHDRLSGTEHNDWLLGESGRDRIAGQGGADLLQGGADNDELLGGAGNDDMHGETGLDTVSYAYAKTRVNAAICACAVSGDFDGGERDVVRPGAENLVGGPYADRLVGDGGPNRLVGGPEGDLLYGMGGADVMPIDGNDWAFGGAGYDLVTYEHFTERVVVWLDERPGDHPGGANVRADVEQVTGGSGNDWLIGNDARNVLRGGPGNDELSGLGGDDLLIGDAGADVYFAGTGDDTCVTDPHDAERTGCQFG